ncbi:MAG: hypothetical protein LBD28_00840 [Tannerellaceae bacterium]|jgi:hypothetical protein|nr:hypothetical protein [Tannerellaceae bacterium]
MKPVIISFFLVILAYSLLSKQEEGIEPAQSTTISLNEKKQIIIADSSLINPRCMFMVSEQQIPMFVPGIYQ